MAKKVKVPKVKRRRRAFSTKKRKENMPQLLPLTFEELCNAAVILGIAKSLGHAGDQVTAMLVKTMQGRHVERLDGKYLLT